MPRISTADKAKLDKLFNMATMRGNTYEQKVALHMLNDRCKRLGIKAVDLYDFPKPPSNGKVIHLDYETYSAINIQSAGAWIYSQDVSTDLICLAWCYNDEDPLIWRNNMYHLDADSHKLDVLFDCVRDGWELHAWNAQFEYYIWNYVAAPKFGWPKVPIEQFHDSQALALSLALPMTLEACGAALNLDIQKDKSGKRLINKLSKPRKPTKYNPAIRWLYDDAVDDYEDMYAYCLQDVRSERAICDVLPISYLPGYERRLWVETVKINDKGVPVDIDTVNNIHSILKEYEREQVAKLGKITNNEVTTPGQTSRMRTWFEEKHGVLLPNMTAETVSKALEDPALPKPVHNVLNIRRLMSRTSTKKYDRILDMIDDEGFVHDIIRYHIATTGRWGGSGLQVHNLPNAKVDDPDLVSRIARYQSLRLFLLFYDDPMFVGSAMVRPIVRAKLGYKLYVSDFTSIENRVVCWLAGDEEALRLFRDHVDQYKWFATKLYYGVAYDDVTKHQRTHAKTCILGLGYGMGVDKFYETCVSYGFDITYAECKRSVDLYREIFNSIVRLWYRSYELAMRTVKTGEATEYLHLKFRKEGKYFYMILPSGRKINYYDARVEPVETPWGETKPGITFMGHQPYTRKWGRLKLIPGRLIENAAQGMARDVMAEAKLRLIDKGYNVIFSVHDEIVSHDPIDYGSLAEFDEIMCDTNYNIYPGLPIDSEGFVTNRYKK